MIMKTFEDDNENFDSDEDNTNNSKGQSDNFFCTLPDQTALQTEYFMLTKE